MLRYKGKLITKDYFIELYGWLYQDYELDRIRNMTRGKWMHGHGGVIVCEAE